MSTSGPYPASLFVAASMPTAAALNQLVRAVNSLQGLPLTGDTERPQAFIYQSVAQSLPNATTTAVLFDAELLDVGAPGHSTSTNTTRWTNNTGATGWFDVTANAVWASNATGYRLATLRLNTVSTLAAPSVNAVNGNTTGISIAQKVQLQPLDFIELTMFQNSGGALNTSPSLPISMTITQSRMQ